MQHAIKLKYVSFAAAVLVALGMATSAFAYDELEIEIDVYNDGVVVEVSYEDGDEEVEDEYIFDETDLDEVYSLLADKLGLTVEEIEAASTSEEEDGSINDEESDDEESEDEESDESDDDDDKEDKDHKHHERCDAEVKNLGQEIRCEVKERNEERKEFRSEVKDRFKAFGQTTDRTELQSQLQELMQLLIALLQQQMALQGSN